MFSKLSPNHRYSIRNLVSVQIIIVLDSDYYQSKLINDHDQSDWSLLLIKIDQWLWSEGLNSPSCVNPRVVATTFLGSSSPYTCIANWSENIVITTMMMICHDSDHFDDDNDCGDLDAVDAPIKESSTTVCLCRQSRSVLVVVLIHGIVGIIVIMMVIMMIPMIIIVMKTFCPKVMTTLTGFPRVSNLVVISLYTGKVLLQTASMKKTPFILMIIMILMIMMIVMIMMIT